MYNTIMYSVLYSGTLSVLIVFQLLFYQLFCSGNVVFVLRYPLIWATLHCEADNLCSDISIDCKFHLCSCE